MFERIFKLKENGTTIKREVAAGLTTFVTMAYIIFVNPNILADAGIPKEAAFGATIFATVLSTMLMAFWANLPVAVAPAMGINAFFAYHVCGALGLHWTVALGAVFISGIVFLLLTVTNVRAIIIASVPANLKPAIAVGVGLFIAMIGLKTTGIVVADPATLVTLGDMTQPSVLLSFLGLLLTGVLFARRVPGSILYGVVAITAASMLLGLSPTPAADANWFSLSMPDISPIFMKLDIMGAVKYGIVSIILTFTIVELFNNMGTLLGLLSNADFKNEKGKIRGLGKALFADSVGVLFSAGLGTSAVSCYAESATGIAAGGRTGLTALVVAILFLCSIIFTPLIALVPSFATAPALIIIGALMMTEIKNVRFDDFTEALPAFLTMVMMPLTYNIASGFSFGFISYAVIKLLTGRAKEVKLFVWITAVFFVISLSMPN